MILNINPILKDKMKTIPGIWLKFLTRNMIFFSHIFTYKNQIPLEIVRCPLQLQENVPPRGQILICPNSPFFQSMPILTLYDIQFQSWVLVGVEVQHVTYGTIRQTRAEYRNVVLLCKKNGTKIALV